MKAILLLITICCFSFNTHAQKPTDILASTTERSFTAQDLSPKIAEAWMKKSVNLANARKALLGRQIERVVLEVEASERKLTVDKLIAIEVERRVPKPTDAQIKAVYDANRQDIGDQTLAQVRQKIVGYLYGQSRKRTYSTFIGTLKTKHKIAFVKDVRNANLEPTDIVATVGRRAITVREFNARNGLVLYEYEANIHDQVIASLKQAVNASLFSSEAAANDLATSDYVAREITNKMRDYSNAEQTRLHSALQKKLYSKYRVRFFVNEPKPFVQTISTDDDPFRGDANARVTVVMFTDIQCPACAAVYPVLKNVIAEYGKSVKFVVRDFPLTSIHKFAFEAAVAANAAHAQNKYFEYKELLYKNQDSLDTVSLIRFAKQLGLNEKRFAADLKRKEFAKEVRHDMKDGEKYGVNSTPTVFVNGIKVRLLSAESFRKAIDKFVIR